VNGTAAFLLSATVAADDATDAVELVTTATPGSGTAVSASDSTAIVILRESFEAADGSQQVLKGIPAVGGEVAAGMVAALPDQQTETWVQGGAATACSYRVEFVSAVGSPFVHMIVTDAAGTQIASPWITWVDDHAMLSAGKAGDGWNLHLQGAVSELDMPFGCATLPMVTFVGPAWSE